MTLHFPNQSRSYDATAGRIRFWGYDGTIEVPFFMQLSALLRLYPRTSNTEAGILAAFDIGWSRICEIAVREYSRDRRYRVVGPESF
jgi:hypothetical protein